MSVARKAFGNGRANPGAFPDAVNEKTRNRAFDDPFCSVCRVSRLGRGQLPELCRVHCAMSSGDVSSACRRPITGLHILRN
jgi:hypothetical protein